MKKRFIKEANQGGQYYLTVDLDERGEYAATLYDYDDNVVWDCDTEQVREMLEDGFLKYKPDEDLDGLAEYLGDIGVIPKGSDIGSEKVEETKMNKGFTQVKEASNGDGTTKFVKYFNDFYGPNGLYPCKLHKKEITWKEIKKGYDAVLKKNPKHKFDGDSVDRELIRDEMIDLGILDPTYNQRESKMPKKTTQNYKEGVYMKKSTKRNLLEEKLRKVLRPVVKSILKEGSVTAKPSEVIIDVVSKLQNLYSGLVEADENNKKYSNTFKNCIQQVSKLETLLPDTEIWIND